MERTAYFNVLAYIYLGRRASRQHARHEHLRHSSYLSRSSGIHLGS